MLYSSIVYEIKTKLSEQNGNKSSQWDSTVQKAIVLVPLPNSQFRQLFIIKTEYFTESIHRKGRIHKNANPLIKMKHLCLSTYFCATLFATLFIYTVNVEGVLFVLITIV